MKKVVCLIIVLFALVPTVFAGDVPESLLYEDEAKVFIGTVENYTTKDIPSSPYTIIDTIEVIPTEKIKGDVKIGTKEIYKRCHSSLVLKSNTEYLFGYFDENNFYIYEIEEKDEKHIKLVGSDDHDMTKRLEDYLNDGTFALAEHERATIGKQISLAEYMYVKPLNNTPVKKVVFCYNGNNYEVSKDEFAEMAENIIITNVKNQALKGAGGEGIYDDVLYMEMLDSNGHLVFFSAVTQYGEVDSYSRMFSRLMTADYKMSSEDVAKLYSLLPEEVQNNLPNSADANTAQEAESIPKKNYTVWFFIGIAFVVFAIAFSIGYKTNKRMNG